MEKRVALDEPRDQQPRRRRERRAHHAPGRANVLRAAVDVRNGAGGPRLVAWIVPGSDALAPPLVRAHAASRLPRALLPARFVEVSDLPVNRAGKLDRAALVEPAAPTLPGIDRPFAGAALVESAAPTASGIDHPFAGAAPPAASPDPLDVAVLQVFRDVLRDPSLTAHAEFFELGDSLLAIELAHRLGRRLGRDVSGNILFRASTPLDVAAALREPAPEGLLGFRPDGARPPLFVLPPGDFELPALRRLAELLPADRPVFVVEPSQAPTLSRLLDRYADSVESRQPDGALHLLGYCVGGQLAFALARTLEARGRDVALVVLVDSPFRESRVGTLAWRAARRVARTWRPVGSSPFARYARGLFLAPGVDGHARVLVGYEPRPWRGRVVYLMARHSHFRLMPTRRRWQRVTSPPMDFGWLPGDHDSVLNEPHVRTLAARLETLLG